MKPATLFFGLIVALSTLNNFSSAYRFLGVTATGWPSHYFVASSLFKELARRGHEVTVISSFPQKKPLANFRDIHVPTVIKAMESKVTTFFDLLDQNVVENVVHIYQMGLRMSEAILSEPEVQTLLKSNDTFDAVICEAMLSESLFGLSEHFNAPLIGFNAFGATPWNTDLVGSPSPPSYVPSYRLQFTDHMTLIERIANLAFITFDRALMEFWYLPKQAAIYKKYFPNSKRDMYEVRKNAALVLVNNHVSLSFSRPYVANQIEVGGMHIKRKIDPLPKNIKKFIEDAEHGVIYFSMGSNLKTEDLPLEKRQALLETFRGLKQRILWKFENPNLPGKPDNVLISAWFPQNDILAHPNVKLFVTHGGLLGITESIYHGKPLVGIPILGDQFLNMARAEKSGFGIMLPYTKLSKETFSDAIQRVLSNPSYTKMATSISARYRDQPMPPLDLAVFWIEHVVRHEGAKYLHCAGQDLNFIQYHNLDAMLILYGGSVFLLILCIFFLYLLTALLLRTYFRQNQYNQPLKIKKN